MTINNTVTAVGISGHKYTFNLHPIGTAYLPIGGLYIFLRKTAEGHWQAVYVGETGDLNQRLNAGIKGHQAWPSICAHRATHIATLAVNDNSARLRIETDLRHGLTPPCNRQ